MTRLPAKGDHARLQTLVSCAGGHGKGAGDTVNEASPKKVRISRNSRRIIKRMEELAEEWWVSLDDVFKAALLVAGQLVGKRVNDADLSTGSRFAYRRFKKIAATAKRAARASNKVAA